MINTKALKTGYTTGTCATVAAFGSAFFLLKHQSLTQAQVLLPKGVKAQLKIKHVQAYKNGAYASVVKDAGDDPDVTHGCVVKVYVELIKPRTIMFEAGEGVGTITKPGLVLKVGEPAINPVPRKMIEENFKKLAVETNYQQGFLVRIGIENGETIAKKTLCPKLGILGGLCILGTTGIVKPFSCGAYISSIYQEIDVAMCHDKSMLILVTGSTSLNFALAMPGVDPTCVIEVGDFLMAAFKRLRRYKVQKIILVSAWSKMIKVAQGNANLHNHFSSVCKQDLCHYFSDTHMQSRLLSANTMLEVIDLFEPASKVDLCARACAFLKTNINANTFSTIAVNRVSKEIARFDMLKDV